MLSDLPITTWTSILFAALYSWRVIRDKSPDKKYMEDLEERNETLLNELYRAWKEAASLKEKNDKDFFDRQFAFDRALEKEQNKRKLLEAKIEELEDKNG